MTRYYRDCDACGRMRRIEGNGMCGACYKAWQRQQREAVAMGGVCSRPRCSEPVAEGWRFHCVEHAAPLAAVRERMDAEARTLASVGNGRRKKAGLPKCCNPECYALRIPPAAFCDACVDAGYTEGED